MQEIDVFVGVELGHFALGGWFGSLRDERCKGEQRQTNKDFHLFVQAVVHH